MNLRMIAHVLCRILFIELLAMIPAVCVSLSYGEWQSAISFVWTMALIGIVCFLLSLIRPRTKTFYATEGYIITGLSWILISFFGSFPFLFSGAIPNFVDCLFETISGFTTTGASILRDVEALPKGLLYWRSFTHWLGGMGILVFALAVIPSGDADGSSLSLLRAESPGPTVGKLTPKIRQSAKVLYLIYIAMSLLQVVLLLFGGMPLFDSFCIMFGTAGTGGFAITNNSIAAYTSDYVQIVITIFMALFGVNFTIYFLLLARQFSQALHDEELRVYIGILVSAFAVIALNIRPLYPTAGEAIRHAAFQTASVMTTTGFATTDYNNWPELSRSILILLMILGASAGSTAGGLKIARVVIGVKATFKEVGRMLHPRSVRVVQLNGKTLDNPAIKGVLVFILADLTVAVVSLLLISLDNMGTTTNLTAVLACINNVGPGLDVVGPMGNYADFSALSKMVLSADMLLGRLEIFPILILFTFSSWRGSRR